VAVTASLTRRVMKEGPSLTLDASGDESGELCQKNKTRRIGNPDRSGGDQLAAGRPGYVDEAASPGCGKLTSADLLR